MKGIFIIIRAGVVNIIVGYFKFLIEQCFLRFANKFFTIYDLSY